MWVNWQLCFIQKILKFQDLIKKSRSKKSTFGWPNKIIQKQFKKNKQRKR